ncbi:hypothetical protein [Actinoplanes siamensis]|uniref:Uncharacterized protein n=1 Tax=Actinoplanes siamensis TaxID=1223317 RepID=A0A919N6Y0_9ACTN|nr:hypothetical protein [Actinoplanes siamensis]GIF05446.1 hypothetical protein Asi03nite_29840 [Actinoplanes siamensis]
MTVNRLLRRADRGPAAWIAGGRRGSPDLDPGADRDQRDAGSSVPAAVVATPASDDLYRTAVGLVVRQAGLGALALRRRHP